MATENKMYPNPSDAVTRGVMGYGVGVGRDDTALIAAIGRLTKAAEDLSRRLAYLEVVSIPSFQKLPMEESHGTLTTGSYPEGIGDGMHTVVKVD